MTTIAAVMRRSYTAGMFDDLDVPPHTREYVKPVTTLTFTPDLTPTQAAQVWTRMESTDDVDQAKRANLRALRDAVVAAPTLENVAALATANANYLLGDQ